MLPKREELVAEFAGRTPAQWGLEVDGVVLRSQSRSICLTFDACGGANGSGYDAELIAALVASDTPATLFLNARWIAANPAVVQDLINNPLFELANHGTLHTPLSVTERDAYGIAGTGSVAQVYDEVVDNHLVMTSLLGSPPRFFRSGTAHFDEVAAEVVRAIGLVPVNFDVNADAGATFTPAQVRSSLLTAGPGSICIGHFNRPESGTAEGVRDAIAELKSGGATFSTLINALG